MMADTEFDPLSDEEQEGCILDTPAGSVDSNMIPLMPILEFPADEKLLAEGWERRFMADPKRLQEATQLYEELGFEVRAEAIQPNELSEVCGSCRVATCRAYVTIYTRKRVG
jgi:hypothetical protein